MEPHSSHPSVHEIEVRLLRRAWWIFPAVGLASMMLLGGSLWYWVIGQKPPPLHGDKLFHLRTWFVSLALLGLPLAWRVGMNLKRPGRLALFLAGMAILVLEMLLSLPVVQSSIWLATRCRLRPEEVGLREVCYIRLEEAAGRDHAEPAIVLMGSSQVLMGIDEQLLRRLVAPMPVIRRAMHGMTPLRALAMSSYVPFRPGDVCVQYLSEYDFTNQDPLPYDWFRPYASWKTWPAVMRSISPATWIPRWTQVVDYTMASLLELWRARDGFRLIVFHFWSREGSAGPSGSDGAEARAVAVAKARSGLEYSPAESNAFHAFSRRLEENGVRWVIFEGGLNPELNSPERIAAKEHIRKQLQDFSGMAAYRYVSQAEQGLDWTGALWLDMTHLNTEGRELLTRRIAKTLVDESRPKP